MKVLSADALISPILTTVNNLKSRCSRPRYFKLCAYLDDISCGRKKSSLEGNVFWEVFDSVGHSFSRA